MTKPLGRDLLFQLLAHYEIPYIFGNPGTSELPFIDGVPYHENVEYITALHEAIAVGMAMGYARQTGKHGVVILHVAPGLANGMGNIYNAHRAGIPLVVIAGQHHSKLLLEEPMLAGDHVGQVASMTKWAHEVRNAEELPMALQRAFKVAITPPMGPVFLSIPYDIAMAPAAVEQIGEPTRIASNFCAEKSALQELAEELLKSKNPLILAGDGVGVADAIEELKALAHETGIGVMSEAMPTRQNYDNRDELFLGTLPMASVPFRNMLTGFDLIFFVGVSAQAPVSVYDNAGSLVPSEARIVYLSHNPWEIGKNYSGRVAAWGEIKSSLQALVEIVKEKKNELQVELEERKEKMLTRARARKESNAVSLQDDYQREYLTANVVAAELAKRLPSDGNFTIVNEAVSNAPAFVDYIDLWEGKQFSAGKGGGLGHGMSQAIGTYLGAKGRRVVSVTGDGTLLYYPQVFYSAAQVHAQVLFLIVNNHSYHILKTGLKALGAPLGKKYLKSLDLDGVADVTKLADAFGIPNQRVKSLTELRDGLEKALATERPYVLDVFVSN